MIFYIARKFIFRIFPSSRADYLKLIKTLICVIFVLIFFHVNLITRQFLLLHNKLGKTCPDVTYYSGTLMAGLKQTIKALSARTACLPEES